MYGRFFLKHVFVILMDFKVFVRRYIHLQDAFSCTNLYLKCSKYILLIFFISCLFCCMLTFMCSYKDDVETTTKDKSRQNMWSQIYCIQISSCYRVNRYKINLVEHGFSFVLFCFHKWTKCSESHFNTGESLRYYSYHTVNGAYSFQLSKYRLKREMVHRNAIVCFFAVTVLPFTWSTWTLEVHKYPLS